MLYSIVAVLVLVLDQAVKLYTVKNIPPQAIGDACKTLIPGVIHMTNVQNYGAAFSILENAHWILVAVSALFILGIIMLISMDIIHTKFGRWTAVLVMAGALGNCIDRVLLGYVVDMFEFELFSFAVFNVADIFITVCGILFCLHVIIYREPEEERNAVPRPEKKRGGLFASRPTLEEEDEEEDEEEEEEDVPAPRRPAKASRSSRRDRAAKEAAIPHWDRSAHRSLEQTLRPVDPDDPFAEWDEDDSLDLKPTPRPAPEPPAPRSARRTPETPAARPSKRQAAPAPAKKRDEFELDMPEVVQPAALAQSAARARQEDDTLPDLDDIGFDEYSLDDILSEFRDI